jgi:hypothetical protein
LDSNVKIYLDHYFWNTLAVLQLATTTSKFDDFHKSEIKITLKTDHQKRQISIGWGVL